MKTKVCPEIKETGQPNDKKALENIMSKLIL